MNNEKHKELIIENDSIYLKLSNEYKRCFEKYLLSIIDLSTIDEKIANSEIGIGKIDTGVTLKSKLDEYMNLNYIVILNNFYIEKLDINQIEILKNGTENEKDLLIKDTYKDVLKNSFVHGKFTDKTFKYNYLDSTSSIGIFDNDSLVFAIYYGSNKYKYGSKEEYLANYTKRIEFLEKIANDIIKKINEKLKLKCNVIYEKI